MTERRDGERWRDRCGCVWERWTLPRRIRGMLICGDIVIVQCVTHARAGRRGGKRPVNVR